MGRWPRLLPVLAPDYVADRIVSAVRRGQHVLLMPRAAHITLLARALLPTSTFDEIAKWLGVLEGGMSDDEQ